MVNMVLLALLETSPISPFWWVGFQTANITAAGQPRKVIKVSPEPQTSQGGHHAGSGYLVLLLGVSPCVVSHLGGLWGC